MNAAATGNSGSVVSLGNHEIASAAVVGSPLGTLQVALQWLGGHRGQPNGIWEEHMDEFVWVRVVTPDWEYTERLVE
jgi:hypothetical protein